MNEWVKRSLELADSSHYLDRLGQIYPSAIPPIRPLGEEVKEQIRSFHAEKDWKNLLKLLFRITQEGHPFPIEHPYASILRQRPELIEKNPGVFQQLGEIVLSMGISEIVRGCERPADINRIMGSAFHRWIRQYFPRQGYMFLSEYEFERSRGPSFLDAANAAILKYVNTKLGLELSRGRDFLFKNNDKCVIGEARFLSTGGGSQTRDLLETLNFVKDAKRDNVIAVAVIDGIIWFNRSYVQRLLELEEDEPALSALLLKDFLQSVA
jgi:hypothetical protein